MRPLYDRIYVRRTEDKPDTGGFIIPDTSREKPSQGVVVAVGKGRVTENGTTVPMQVAVNDTVLFGKYAGTEAKINGEELLVMREEEVLGIL